MNSDPQQSGFCKFPALYPVFLLVLFQCVFCAASDLQATSAARPNVLLIAIDDLNDIPGFMGRNPDALTPNMDRLAGESTVFHRAYANFPLCGPSRASFLSGLLPTSIGFDDHMTNQALKDRADELGVTLLDTYFKSNGYRVFSAGKIYHAGHPPGPVDGTGGNASFGAKEGIHYFHELTSTDWGIPSYGGMDQNFSDFTNARYAVERLGEVHQDPFLLMIGFVQPHVPWYAPQPYFDLYPNEQALKLAAYDADDLNDVSESAINTSIGAQYPRTDWAISNGQRAKIQQAYLACVSFTDYYLGLVLDALESSPYADNTVVVLLSDNGYHLGEKNTYQKETLWERSSHIPLLVKIPGQPAQSLHQVVSLLDLYPTLLDLCSLPENNRLEGRSLEPLILNPSMEWDYPAITSFRGNNHAVQTSRYRYIRWNDGSEELYDHQNDPEEHENLAGQKENRELMDQLLKELPTSLSRPDKGLRIQVKSDSRDQAIQTMFSSGALRLYGIPVYDQNLVIEGMKIGTREGAGWIQFVPQPASGFGYWRTEIFDSAELGDLHLSGALSNMDMDGYPLLAEYAFGLSPRNRDCNTVGSLYESTGPSSIRIALPARTTLNDVRYRLYRSMDIASPAEWDLVATFDSENGPQNLNSGELSWSVHSLDHLALDLAWGKNVWFRISIVPNFIIKQSL